MAAHSILFATLCVQNTLIMLLHLCSVYLEPGRTRNRIMVTLAILTKINLSHVVAGVHTEAIGPLWDILNVQNDSILGTKSQFLPEQRKQKYSLPGLSFSPWNPRILETQGQGSRKVWSMANPSRCNHLLLQRAGSFLAPAADSG